MHPDLRQMPHNDAAPDPWQRSRELLDRSQRSLAGGVASSLRTAIRPTPLFVQSAAGSHITDVDGNDYVDYTMAYGPLILGHAHPEIVGAVAKAAARGTTFGAQHQDEIDLAERICRYVGNAELVCLTGSGTEAVGLALRLARAATGRQRVIRFHGHYHGWSDAVFVSADSSSPDGRARPGTLGQSERALDDLIVVPWNDVTAVESALHEHGAEVAAILCEPFLCNAGCLTPRAGYYERLRELVDERGCLLIFDEVITGFRLGLGGAQERLRIHADLVVLGKALAGGLPLAAVAGPEALLGLVADGTVSHLGTMNGNTVATAAARATVDVLARDGGAAYGHMAALSRRLVEGIERAGASAGIPLVVNNLGQAFHTVFVDSERVDDYEVFVRRDVARTSRFVELLLAAGVYVRPNGLWYLSTEHDAADIDRTIAAVDDAMRALH